METGPAPTRWSADEVTAEVGRERAAIGTEGPETWPDPPRPIGLRHEAGTITVWLIAATEAGAVFFDDVEEDFGVARRDASGELRGYDLHGPLGLAVAALRRGDLPRDGAP